MDDVKVAGDVGGTIDVESTFAVGDIAHLTEFTKVTYFAAVGRYPLTQTFTDLAHCGIIRLGHFRR